MEISKKRTLIYSLAVLPTAFLTKSCSVREARKPNEYIKSFNNPSYIKSPIINSNSFISNDHEALLSSPLIRWKYSNKPKYDSVNKLYLKVTSKSLELNLAKEITLYFYDDSTKTYNKDFVMEHDEASTSGLVRVYTNEKNNINNKEFIDDLCNAKKIEIKLKDDIYFVDKNNCKTDEKVNLESFKNSFNYKDNLKELNKILAELKLKMIDSKEVLSFEKTDKNEKSLFLFVTKFLTSNSLFMPLYSSEPDEKNMLFVSPYILKNHSVSTAEYERNKFYVNKKFTTSSENLNKVMLKFNPVPVDESTYRMQCFNSFRQNLISEAKYNLFNDNQKTDIDNFSRIYGLSYYFSKPSDTNSNKYFINFDYTNQENLYFNDAFSKLAFNKTKEELKTEKANFYNSNSLTFWNIVHNIQNQYVGNKILGHGSYWNSLFSQTMYFDTKHNENEFLFKNLKDINKIDVNYFESSKFNQDIINFDTVGDKKGLVDYAFSREKVLDINKQLETVNYLKYKKILNKLIDDFFEKNNELKDEKITWTIPVFSEYTYDINEYYSRLINMYENLDKRLKPTFEFVDENDSNYIYKYTSFNMIDNSFAESLFSLIDLQNSIIFNIVDFIKTYKNKNEKPKFYNKLFDLYEVLETLLNVDLEKAESIYKTDKNSKILEQILSENNLNKSTFKNEFINRINSLNKNEQFVILKAIDNLLFIHQNENSFLFANDFEKEIVQFFYTKPLNDQGFTYYQDIDVLTQK